MSAGTGFHLRPGWIKAGAVLLLVAGLFLLGVLLTPPAAPVQALSPASASANPLAVGNGVKGTLASFTALISQSIVVNLPLVIR
jgi:hypothetical protein